MYGRLMVFHCLEQADTLCLQANNTWLCAWEDYDKYVFSNMTSRIRIAVVADRLESVEAGDRMHRQTRLTYFRLSSS